MKNQGVLTVHEHRYRCEIMIIYSPNIVLILSYNNPWIRPYQIADCFRQRQLHFRPFEGDSICSHGVYL